MTFYRGRQLRPGEAPSIVIEVVDDKTGRVVRTFDATSVWNTPNWHQEVRKVMDRTDLSRFTVRQPGEPGYQGYPIVS